MSKQLNFPGNQVHSHNSSAAAKLSATTAVRSILHSLWHWAVQHREILWIGAMLLVAGLAHGINMFNTPYVHDDEGIYFAQAWANATHARLANYTYWYDHAPLGCLQIALWIIVTGGFHTLGTATESGRMFMLLVQIGSTYALYDITRNISKNVITATIATLVFALSALGLYWHRRVMLDNIMTFWMLLSIFFIVRPQFSLRHVWLSAVALGISILSKETTVFIVPVLLYILYRRVHPSHRWFAVVGWSVLVGSIVSLYILMAILKGELFPQGTMLGGLDPHVSLIETVQWQASRGKDGGIFEANSYFWRVFPIWSGSEPLLVVGGTVCAFLSTLFLRRRQMVGGMGLVSLALWAFNARGGIVNDQFIVPLLPMLALNLALVIDVGVDFTAQFLRHHVAFGTVVQRSVSLCGLGLCLLGTITGYNGPYLSRQVGHTWSPWSNQEAVAQQQALDWIKRYVPLKSSIVMDSALWTDLHDLSEGDDSFGLAHYYYKVHLDPEIKDGVFHNNWQNIDYLVTNPTFLNYARYEHMDQVLEALAHSTPVVVFDTGGWPIVIRQVHKPYQAMATNEILVKTWQDYKQRFITEGRVQDLSNNQQTTSEGQSYALLRAVYMDDQETFDQVWAWTKTHLQREDGLLAWHWGSRTGRMPEVLDREGATDADQDTALALLFASQQWSMPQYKQEALHILRGIWEHETAIVAGQRMLVAGPWAVGDGADRDAVVNPSFFAPYAYRIFAEADTHHAWNELVNSSYNVLAQLGESKQFGGQIGLVPNLVAINGTTGELRPASDFGDYANEFSFDASRLPWRLAVDWLWFKDWRAKVALDRLTYPLEKYRQDGKLLASYKLDGSPVANYEALSMYAGVLPIFMFDLDRDLPYQLYSQTLLQSYHQSGDTAYWGDPNNYYDQNWAWFATALVNGEFGNLWLNQTTIQWNDSHTSGMLPTLFTTSVAASATPMNSDTP